MVRVNIMATVSITSPSLSICGGDTKMKLSNGNEICKKSRRAGALQ